MNSAIRNIQLVAVIIVLAATIIAFFLEILQMYENRDVNLADLLLMFIYIEVIGLVRSYWESRAVTPVPGGVGPMTIACLLKNTLECFKDR